MRAVFIMFLLSMCSCTALNDTFSPDPMRPPLNLSGPKSLSLHRIKFKVIHKDNAETRLAEIEASGEEPVVFALSGTDYKNLAINMQELKAYILIQRKIINLYKEYYEGVSNE